MVKNLLFLLLLICLSVTVASAQDMLVLQGRVQDRNSAGIPGATVRLLNTNLSTSADGQGNFRIDNVLNGLYTVQVSALGYATITKYVNLQEAGETVTIQLTESASQLDEVVVSAQKREEDLRRVPISITALSSRQVQEFRLWNLRDVTAISPNTFAADPGDNRNVTSIRGIATTSYDPAVATYVDGVNQFNLDTYIPELLDVERIEVLRGPQGTLYGRNAMGGVINVITRQPGNTVGGFASIDLGNYGLQRYSLGVRAPIVKDKLYFGAAALYRKLDGYYTNVFNQTDFDRLNVVVGNYYLKYQVNPRLSLTLNAKHSLNRNWGAFTLAPSIEDALANPFEVNQNQVGKMKDNTFNTSLALYYTGSNLNISSQTAYQSNYRIYEQPVDGDFSPIDGVSILNNYGRDWNKVRVVTQEIRISSPTSAASPFQWVAGAYGFYNDNPVKQGTYFGRDAELLGAPFTNFTSINVNEGKSHGVAFFGQASYWIQPKLELTAGLRYDYERREQAVRGEFQMDGEELQVVVPDTSSEASFKALSPKATLAYHITENYHLFASYSRGFRAGGISQLSSDESQPPLFPYDPEYSNNYEVGLKTSFFQNRAQLNVSAFYTRVTDAQVPTLVLPEAIIVTRNVGELTSKGVEVELNAAPAKGLEVTYGFGFTDAEYNNLIVGSGEEEVNLEGNKQIFTPNVTSMLALQYGYDLGAAQKLRLVARGEWRYLGKQYFDLANQLSQEGYGLLNARVGVQTRRLELFLWGRNLTDEKYIDYAYNFGAARLGNPATYGVSIRGNF
ncbi:TonB-dependent receptor [Sabulibacter ruber]|uniref:TonB-dependent receptor n=1 Tax=Sabulibacter ruber TaxID=2811901 RepID=UPI001A964A78|nr:TonB-dependent receptor [Sabulibacter ruber]